MPGKRLSERAVTGRPRFPTPYRVVRAYMREDEYEAAQRVAQQNGIQLAAFVRATLRAATADPSFLTKGAGRP